MGDVLHHHGLENLFVSDASLFLTSSAMAPTLTIAALSLWLGWLLRAVEQSPNWIRRKAILESARMIYAAG
ncbi:MAG: GMC oxidoreductase [Rhodothermales bacterium]|nr:GMC oxidoreductase [Rhodothermales bacterium]